MVKIITDTTSVLPKDIAERYQISIIPQLIHFGEDTYLEGLDIDIDTFMALLETSPKLPKTAPPPPQVFSEIFQDIVPTGEPILCIHPSKEVSGTVRAAKVAAQDFPEADIRIIDTRLIASPVGTLVQLAAEWAEEGQSIDTIESGIRNLMSRCRVYFLVATLDYLARGGRIGKASALLGTALQIKPILTIRDGQIEPLQKERTMKHALNAIKTFVEWDYPNTKTGYLSIMHASVPDQAQALAEYFKEKLKISPPPIYNLPPAIITHAGPGALAVSFFEE